MFALISFAFASNCTSFSNCDSCTVNDAGVESCLACTEGFATNWNDTAHTQIRECEPCLSEWISSFGGDCTECSNKQHEAAENFYIGTLTCDACETGYNLELTGYNNTITTSLMNGTVVDEFTQNQTACVRDACWWEPTPFEAAGGAVSEFRTCDCCAAETSVDYECCSLDACSNVQCDSEKSGSNKKEIVIIVVCVVAAALLMAALAACCWCRKRKNAAETTSTSSKNKNSKREPLLIVC